ncbi:MAG: glutamine--fructose-6-phosphate transaminase (isomerizing) [Christensenellaceae bacterium]|nr:glutamine--fructose-6-phosphate transaminase (isomerizing) [Christensenellaceae bacterium]
MCGIVGYAGPRDVVPVLTGGLEKLEYRGYDSAGIAFVQDEQLKIIKTKGRIKDLKERLGGASQQATIGIGHTRWATHGEPSDVNSHPHTNVAGSLAVVHNGIIENFQKLKEWLQEKGVTFVSQTDTEVVAHLVNYYYEGDLRMAVVQAVKMLEGSYALGVVSVHEPEKIVAVRKDSPLIIGLGEGENFIASDVPAILEYTRKVYFLEDNEIAELDNNSVAVYDIYGRRVKKDAVTIDWDAEQAEKAGYEHFMIKEIYEQPKALADTLLPRIKDGRIDLSDAHFTKELIDGVEKIFIVACGTASYAGQLGKYIIEKLARVPVEVDVGSEFRYRDPILQPGQLVIVISQSGETADTIAAMREAKKNGLKVIAITNVVGSTLAREADAVFYTRAGMEIAVASTKAYITQQLALYMIGMEVARFKGRLSDEEYDRLLNELQRIPELAQQMLEKKEEVQKIAAARYGDHHAFYIGRGMDYAMAMEGTMKLKEVSYIHAEAFSAGELKHGTIALIDREARTLVLALASQKHVLDKMMSNIKEVKARGGYVLAITQERDAELMAKEVDQVLTLPNVDDLFAPMLEVIPMQMIGYYMAVSKGFDPDKPRNLAMSVTVE